MRRVGLEISPSYILLSSASSYILYGIFILHIDVYIFFRDLSNKLKEKQSLIFLLSVSTVVALISFTIFFAPNMLHFLFPITLPVLIALKVLIGYITYWLIVHMKYV